jgi:predicted DNA-binding transcriptional regulator AlpA
MESDQLIPFFEVGRILGGRSVKTVRRMVAGGELPKPVYVGRTPMLFLSEVGAYLEKLKEKRSAAQV